MAKTAKKAKPKRPPRARTASREQARRHDKLVEARLKLAALEPGGAEAHPVEVASASVVEARGEAERCPRCDEPLRTEEHAVVETARGLVRKLTLRCRSCGLERAFYVRVAEKLLN